MDRAQCQTKRSSAAWSVPHSVSISSLTEGLVAWTPALSCRQVGNATAHAVASHPIGGREMVDFYLNYDGLLHPDGVSYSRACDGQLLVGGHALFEHHQLWS